LFGIVILAKGPKTASDAAGHDDAEIVHWCVFVNKDFPFSLR
jgi:hypothetical protein